MSTLIALNSKALEFTSKPLQMFIGGRWIDAISGKRTEIRNPATGELITTAAEGDKEDVDLAVAAARKAFEEGPWPKMKPNERAKLILKLADLIEENAEELAHLDTLDYGQPVSLTTGFAAAAADNFRYYAGWTTKITGETIPSSTPGNIFNYTIREPIGVCAGIVPWNAPLMNAIMKISAPLAVGNTVIVKPSEETPISLLRFAELVQKAGFPDGVVNIVTGYGHTVGAALSSHTDVDKIAFTGSTAVGKEIIQNSAVNIKKVTLELGGKSAHIIFDDADYETALANAANSIFFNSGQVCFAGSRLFVEKGIYDRFLADLAEYSKNYRVGNGFDKETVIGPLISSKQKERVLNYLDIGQREGAEMLIGGNATEADLANGHFVKPTVMANVHHDMTIVKEEIFGPVVSAMPFDDIDEVIKQANNTVYGLGGGICTTDIRKAHKVAHALRTGNVWVNTYNITEPGSPFGGYKQSGLGRENGAASIDMYTEIKNIWINLD
ncbi:aldehyde dehydrogenase family protein [Alkalihalobacillus sp. MEB130]|uniref:aldehyde dehydrogenase family protein n=1 Tax=Alkalihalobacillus sp. MEB130 TaxID=2976704 RepID=UPI0028E08C00|nr:aldehyde dehydrogenase family protein [Alkalihalobacillus sp. MEB130]MDT8860252.1 aldehyde dehydrogenase family protein [Alkalihalobacillus sp. MEB130]